MAVSKPIYLDYAATTPVAPEVVATMTGHLSLDGVFANPASKSHFPGWQADEAVEMARQQVAELVGADPREIIWTSGATEADNLAIKGVAEFHQQRGKHIVTSAIEHKAVLDSCQYLAARGFDITYLQPDAKGLIRPEQVANALREDSILVSLMQLNNELGTLTDIQGVAEITRARGVLLHVDAAQSAGKVAIDLQQLPVDLMSFSAHKIYGPKGIGALYVRRQPEARLAPQMHGGGHERGLRSGTLPTHQIVGMGAAFARANRQFEQDQAHINGLRQQLIDGMLALPGVTLNGDSQQRASGIVNLAFAGVEGETLLLALRDIAVASGSACNSASLAPSYVLSALGLDDQLALASLRFSLGLYTTQEEIEFTIDLVADTLQRLRS